MTIACATLPVVVRYTTHTPIRRSPLLILQSSIELFGDLWCHAPPHTTHTYRPTSDFSKSDEHDLTIA
jgi:hypothetical protein